MYCLSEENGSVMSALKDLPAFDGTHLQQMEEEISELQDEALKSFLGRYIDHMVNNSNP